MVTSWVKDNLKLSVGQLEIIAEYIKSMRELDLFRMIKDCITQIFNGKSKVGYFFQV